ncbi:Arabinose-proton symporter [Klebsiella michiganensis]|uniref:Arabinose-proton symporter n=1 Tax=Klebsiella michiganensis TaxID=1134687 RepID=A0A7H4PKM2_9ENTR|nr:Arabinose-proton symporter [Klebsiella michiganensis]
MVLKSSAAPDSQKEPPSSANVLNGVFSVGGMLFGVLYLVDRFKRKTIIIYGFAIMATLHLIIAGVDYTLVGDIKATAIWLLGAMFVGVMQGNDGLYHLGGGWLSCSRSSSADCRWAYRYFSCG